MSTLISTIPAAPISTANPENFGESTPPTPTGKDSSALRDATVEDFIDLMIKTGEKVKNLEKELEYAVNAYFHERAHRLLVEFLHQGRVYATEAACRRLAEHVPSNPLDLSCGTEKILAGIALRPILFRRNVEGEAVPWKRYEISSILLLHDGEQVREGQYGTHYRIKSRATGEGDEVFSATIIGSMQVDSDLMLYPPDVAIAG